MAAVDLRYARALAGVVEERKLEPSAVQAQLSDFAATLAASSELREVLEDPSIPESQKLGLLDALAAKLKLDRVVRNFIATITNHQRLSELDEIIAAYTADVDQAGDVADVEIVTARPLSSETKGVLEAQVAKLVGGHQVRASYSEDGSLLGGAVVRVGSTVYDGSIRAQLQLLKQRLMTAGL